MVLCYVCTRPVYTAVYECGRVQWPALHRQLLIVMTVLFTYLRQTAAAELQLSVFRSNSDNIIRPNTTVQSD